MQHNLYVVLLSVHSVIRWIVLGCLNISIIKSAYGLQQGNAFSSIDNTLRHWTATVAHIQLMVGIVLYTQSPLVSQYWRQGEGAPDTNMGFFALIHLVLMALAIILITIGSALAKRKQGDAEKFKTMLVWFVIALLIILVAIPWPFSPLASRPYFR